MRIKHLIPFAVVPLLWGCPDSSKNNDEDTYDVTSILNNTAANIVTPNHLDFKDASSDLKVKTATFVATPNTTNLTALRASFKTTYEAWQAASAANFGIATTTGLSVTINSFPTDTAEINDIFDLTNPNLAQASYINSTGLPGLDYALFEGSDSDVLNRFTNPNNGAGAKYYLTGVVDIINDNATNAYNFWKNDENGYKSGFIADNSRSAGSAFSEFLNGYIQQVEVLKNAQMGVPAGEFTLGTIRPEQTEALFSNYSKELYIAHLDVLRRMYKGEDAAGNDGIGLDDYVDYLDVKRNGEDLNQLILGAFDILETKINQVTGSVKDGVENQQSLMSEIFLENKKLVAYLKVDMMNAFNVQITYNSGDGD